MESTYIIFILCLISIALDFNKPSLNINKPISIETILELPNEQNCLTLYDFDVHHGFLKKINTLDNYRVRLPYDDIHYDQIEFSSELEKWENMGLIQKLTFDSDSFIFFYVTKKNSINYLLEDLLKVDPTYLEWYGNINWTLTSYEELINHFSVIFI